MHKSGLRVQSGVEEGCRNGLEQIQSDGAVVFGEVRVGNPSAGCGPLVDVPQARLQVCLRVPPVEDPLLLSDNPGEGRIAEQIFFLPFGVTSRRMQGRDPLVAVCSYRPERRSSSFTAAGKPRS